MSASDLPPPAFDGIDESAVATLATFAGFAFQPEELPAIAAQLRRACDIASPLLTCELDDDEEMGPIWRP